MNYRLRRRGEDLGVFSLDELRRRHESGELTGGEYVQREGMPDWQPLDLVLQQGYRVAPPPLPSQVSQRRGPRPVWIWAIAGAGAVFFVVVLVMAVGSVQRNYVRAVQQSQRRSLSEEHPEAVAVAGQPVVWTTNTLTQADATRRAREFRLRQWLDGYEKRGQRNFVDDAEVIKFLQTWIARNYGGDAATNPMSLAAESDRLSADANCTDPLVLTVVANESGNGMDAIRRFERALAGYPGSQHRAYPRLYATVWLAGYYHNQPQREASLDASALALLPKCFADGSFKPGDQQEVAEIFVNGWGNGFFARNAAAVCAVAHRAGPDYRWLALTLDGDREIAAAWAARGGGYASTVSQQGWEEFNSHLAAARSDLTDAWELQPGWPLAPERMIYVSLGDSGLPEMRRWFDRTTTAQIDYPKAWSDLRWGLRPRWYGNEPALLALGKAAVATGRFDTDVPRKFMDCIYDVESEMNLPRGRHIFGRSDVWPQIEKIYTGYLDAPALGRYRDGWRSAYAIVAYHAGKYDVARAQLEALNWKPDPAVLSEWNLDAALWPLEVAARTGPLGGKISAAEALCRNGNIAGALKQYKELSSDLNADARTREFIQKRIVSLGDSGWLIAPQQYPVPTVRRTN